MSSKVVGVAKIKEKMIIKNRKAFHDYEMIEKFESGIVLHGTEVKSFRRGQVNFKDSYVKVLDGELWVVNMHVSPYEHGSIYNHDPTRARKLLLHKREIKRLARKIEESGLTVIPLSAYFKNGVAKVQIALARGKKTYDKRKDIAKRDADRDAQRELKNKFRIKT